MGSDEITENISGLTLDYVNTCSPNLRARYGGLIISGVPTRASRDTDYTAFLVALCYGSSRTFYIPCGLVLSKIHPRQIPLRGFESRRGYSISNTLRPGRSRLIPSPTHRPGRGLKEDSFEYN